MGLLSRAGDTYYALRFLRLLTTPWKNTGAYKAGIIGAKGELLRKPETSEDKSVYNVFHKLVYNIKRLLTKVPFGQSVVGRYAAALYLIKEHTGLSDELIGECLYELYGFNPSKEDVMIESLDTIKDNQLIAGEYKVKDGCVFLSKDYLTCKGDIVYCTEDTDPVGEIFGVSIFKLTHLKTKNIIYTTTQDIDL